MKLSKKGKVFLHGIFSLLLFFIFSNEINDDFDRALAIFIGIPLSNVGLAAIYEIWILSKIHEIIIKRIEKQLQDQKRVEISGKFTDKIEAIYKDINNNNNEINRLYSVLNKNTIIPEAYHKSHILKKFSEYLVNLRADTLKECINLYERELQIDNLRSGIASEIEDQSRSLQKSLDGIESPNHYLENELWNLRNR